MPAKDEDEETPSQIRQREEEEEKRGLKIKEQKDLEQGYVELMKMSTFGGAHILKTDSSKFAKPWEKNQANMYLDKLDRAT